jgi:predicted O-methyltransferase YrrM
VTARADNLVAEVAALYARLGYTLGETPAHFYLDQLRAGGTIHKDEVWALQHLLDPATDGTAYVVGASFGFSSVVLATLLPRVRVVTVDNWSEGADVAAAKAACESLAALPHDPGPRLVFATGDSPGDTPHLLSGQTGAALRLVLIDGLHTNAQLVADYEGVEPWLDEGSMVLLHDVRLFDLWAGVRAIASRQAFDTLVQLNTSTGLVVAFNRGRHPDAFAFLLEPQVVAHWHPDEAEAPGPTTSYPAIDWDGAADARERRYDASPRAVVRGQASPPAPADSCARPPLADPIGLEWLDPRPGRYARAALRDRAGELTSAAHEYRRLSALWPAERTAIRYNLASVLARLGQVERARTLYRGIGGDTGARSQLRAGALFHLGRLAEHAGQVAAARDYYRAALLLMPDHATARDRLAAIAGGEQPGVPPPRAARRRPPPVDRPLLVYQMGKVGSTSIVAGLIARLPSVEVRQVHALHESTLRTYEAWLAADPQLPASLVSSTREQFDAARTLRTRLLGDGPRWRVVALTREPMAHLVSVLFQHFELYQRLSGGHDAPTTDRLSRLHAYVVESLRRWMSAPERIADDPPRAAFSLSSRWFDTEMQPVLGVDIMRAPFPADRGYALVRSARADVAVVRCEDLGWAAAEAIRALCGQEGFVVPAKNRAQTRPSGWLYHEYLRRCRFPDDVVAAVYATRYARHFYSDAERRALVARWSSPG